MLCTRLLSPKPGVSRRRYSVALHLGLRRFWLARDKLVADIFQYW
jgi:hypothetical protein